MIHTHSLAFVFRQLLITFYTTFGLLYDESAAFSYQRDMEPWLQLTMSYLQTIKNPSEYGKLLRIFNYTYDQM